MSQLRAMIRSRNLKILEEQMGDINWQEFDYSAFSTATKALAEKAKAAQEAVDEVTVQIVVGKLKDIIDA